MAVVISKQAKGRRPRGVCRWKRPVVGHRDALTPIDSEHLGERHRSAGVVLAAEVVLADRDSRAGVALGDPGAQHGYQVDGLGNPRLVSIGRVVQAANGADALGLGGGI